MDFDTTDHANAPDYNHQQTVDTTPLIHNLSDVFTKPRYPKPVEIDQALEEQLVLLASNINAAQYRFLVLLQEFDLRGAWNCGRTRSCAHWLNWRCGISLGPAREKVRVAHALPELPKISDAFEAGHISFSKVRAMTRVATKDNEAQLLNIARYGTASQLEKLVRAYRRIESREELAKEREKANRQHYSRTLKYYWDDDNCLILKAKLSPEQGALVLNAIEAAYESLRKDETNEDTKPESVQRKRARRVDALELLANHWLEQPPAKESKRSDRFQIVVNVDAHALAHSTAHCSHNQLPQEPQPLEHNCSINGERALPADTARRLSCDCSVVGVLMDGQQPLTVGRKTRVVPPHILRALKNRDRGCRFPGCCSNRYLQAHHVKHWSNGGETSLDNLVHLCSHHHHLVHEGGFSVEASKTSQEITNSGIKDTGNTQFHFFDPKNNRIPATPFEDPLSTPQGFDRNPVEKMYRLQSIGKTPRTYDSLWHYNGETLDYDTALMNLFKTRDKAAAA